MHHATYEQLAKLHATADRIRRRVCEMFVNAERIALPGPAGTDAVAANGEHTHELLRELVRLDALIADVPASDVEGEMAVQ